MTSPFHRCAIGLLVVGVACARHASPTKPAPVLQWTAGPTLPIARDHHVTFLTHSADGRRASLWVAGGNDYRTVLADVSRLQLDSNGAPLGEWSTERPLPIALAGPGVAVTDRSVIIAGGQDKSLKKRAEVYVATITSDGGLGEWRSAPSLPWPAFHGSLAYARGWIYATGGLAERVSVGLTARARVAADGTLGEWTAMAPMTRPRSHHASWIMREHLCIAGGLDGNPAGANVPLSSVQCAHINSDGSIGAWEMAGTLPVAVATHAIALGPDWIALLGGVVDNRDVTAGAWTAAISQNGAVGPWTHVADLPNARSHVHQAPVWNGRVYSVGGSANRVVSGALHVSAPLR